jgi:hypothetical protein
MRVRKPHLTRQLQLNGRAVKARLSALARRSSSVGSRHRRTQPAPADAAGRFANQTVFSLDEITPRRGLAALAAAAPAALALVAVARGPPGRLHRVDRPRRPGALGEDEVVRTDVDPGDAPRARVAVMPARSTRTARTAGLALRVGSHARRFHPIRPPCQDESPASRTILGLSSIRRRDGGAAAERTRRRRATAR